MHEYVGQVECEDDHAVEPQRMCKVNVFRLLTSELRRNPKDEPPDRRGKKERQRVQLVEKMVECVDEVLALRIMGSGHDIYRGGELQPALVDARNDG